MSHLQQNTINTRAGAISAASIPSDFNWNSEFHQTRAQGELTYLEPTPQQILQTELLSECLRDGLHGVPFYPPLDKIFGYIDLLQLFGIKHATVGIYTGENNRVNENIKKILAYMRDKAPLITPSVLCPCTPASMKWTIECKDVHPQLEAVIFMGTAPSRRWVQEWDLKFVLRQLSSYVSQAINKGIPVIGATEHTTQTPPDDLTQIIKAHVEHGAYRFLIADTIGIARPRGVYNIVRFVYHVLRDIGTPHIKIDWHGHRDTGNALANALVAMASGAHFIHIVSRGVGERAGNTALEDLVLNLSAILGEAGLLSPWNMPLLLRLLSSYEDIVAIHPPEYGPLGKRFSHTTLGIHTDAILKANVLAEQANQSHDVMLANELRKMARTIYSAVDPCSIGSSPSVGVSPWSGQSSVKLAYLSRGGDIQNLSSQTIEDVLQKAKELERELTEEELEQLFALH